ncbi:hypothetical protein J6590_029182 [Homalodisca vitripennis]|nr:hypothetical protein J6590_029182 [Homalodisca vitripennis]
MYKQGIVVTFLTIDPMKDAEATGNSQCLESIMCVRCIYYLVTFLNVNKPQECVELPRLTRGLTRRWTRRMPRPRATRSAWSL